MVSRQCALLLRVLALAAPDNILDEARTGQIFTTGSWYYRLAKAWPSHESSALCHQR